MSSARNGFGASAATAVEKDASQKPAERRMTRWNMPRRYRQTARAVNGVGTRCKTRAGITRELHAEKQTTLAIAPPTLPPRDQPRQGHIFVGEGI